MAVEETKEMAAESVVEEEIGERVREKEVKFAIEKEVDLALQKEEKDLEEETKDTKVTSEAIAEELRERVKEKEVKFALEKEMELALLNAEKEMEFGVEKEEELSFQKEEELEREKEISKEKVDMSLGENAGVFEVMSEEIKLVAEVGKTDIEDKIDTLVEHESFNESVSNTYNDVSQDEKFEEKDKTIEQQVLAEEVVGKTDNTPFKEPFVEEETVSSQGLLEEPEEIVILKFTGNEDPQKFEKTDVPEEEKYLAKDIEPETLSTSEDMRETSESHLQDAEVVNDFEESDALSPEKQETQVPDDKVIVIDERDITQVYEKTSIFEEDIKQEVKQEGKVDYWSDKIKDDKDDKSKELTLKADDSADDFWNQWKTPAEDKLKDKALAENLNTQTEAKKEIVSDDSTTDFWNQWKTPDDEKLKDEALAENLNRQSEAKKEIVSDDSTTDFWNQWDIRKKEDDQIPVENSVQQLDSTADGESTTETSVSAFWKHWGASDKYMSEQVATEVTDEQLPSVCVAVDTADNSASDIWNRKKTSESKENLSTVNMEDNMPVQNNTKEDEGIIEEKNVLEPTEESKSWVGDEEMKDIDSGSPSTDDIKGFELPIRSEAEIEAAFEEQFVAMEDDGEEIMEVEEDMLADGGVDMEEDNDGYDADADLMEEETDYLHEVDDLLVRRSSKRPEWLTESEEMQEEEMPANPLLAKYLAMPASLTEEEEMELRAYLAENEGVEDIDLEHYMAMSHALTEQEEQEFTDAIAEKEKIREAERQGLDKFLSMPVELTDQERQELLELEAEEQEHAKQPWEEGDAQLEDYLNMPSGLTEEERRLLEENVDDDVEFEDEEQYRQYVKQKFLRQLDEEAYCMAGEEGEYEYEDDYEGEYEYDEEEEYDEDEGDMEGEYVMVQDDMEEAAAAAAPLKKKVDEAVNTDPELSPSEKKLGKKLFSFVKKNDKEGGESEETAPEPKKFFHFGGLGAKKKKETPKGNLDDFPPDKKYGGGGGGDSLGAAFCTITDKVKGHLAEHLSLKKIHEKSKIPVLVRQGKGKSTFSKKLANIRIKSKPKSPQIIHETDLQRAIDIKLNTDLVGGPLASETENTDDTRSNPDIKISLDVISIQLTEKDSTLGISTPETLLISRKSPDVIIQVDDVEDDADVSEIVIQGDDEIDAEVASVFNQDVDVEELPTGLCPEGVEPLKGGGSPYDREADFWLQWKNEEQSSVTAARDSASPWQLREDEEALSISPVAQEEKRASESFKSVDKKGSNTDRDEDGEERLKSVKMKEAVKGNELDVPFMKWGNEKDTEIEGDNWSKTVHVENESVLKNEVEVGKKVESLKESKPSESFEVFELSNKVATCETNTELLDTEALRCGGNEIKILDEKDDEEDMKDDSKEDSKTNLEKFDETNIDKEKVEDIAFQINQLKKCIISKKEEIESSDEEISDNKSKTSEETEESSERSEEDKETESKMDKSNEFSSESADDNIFEIEHEDNREEKELSEESESNNITGSENSNCGEASEETDMDKTEEEEDEIYGETSTESELDSHKNSREEDGELEETSGESAVSSEQESEDKIVQDISEENECENEEEDGESKDVLNITQDVVDEKNPERYEKEDISTSSGDKTPQDNNISDENGEVSRNRNLLTFVKEDENLDVSKLTNEIDKPWKINNAKWESDKTDWELNSEVNLCKMKEDGNTSNEIEMEAMKVEVKLCEKNESKILCDKREVEETKSESPLSLSDIKPLDLEEDLFLNGEKLLGKAKEEECEERSTAKSGIVEDEESTERKEKEVNAETLTRKVNEVDEGEPLERIMTNEEENALVVARMRENTSFENLDDISISDISTRNSSDHESLSPSVSISETTSLKPVQDIALVALTATPVATEGDTENLLEEFISNKGEKLLSSKHDELLSVERCELLSHKKTEHLSSEEDELLSSIEFELQRHQDDDDLSRKMNELLSSKEDDLLTAIEKELLPPKEDEILVATADREFNPKEVLQTIEEENISLDSSLEKESDDSGSKPCATSVSSDMKLTDSDRTKDIHDSEQNLCANSDDSSEQINDDCGSDLVEESLSYEVSETVTEKTSEMTKYADNSGKSTNETTIGDQENLINQRTSLNSRNNDNTYKCQNQTLNENGSAPLESSVASDHLSSLRDTLKSTGNDRQVLSGDEGSHCKGENTPVSAPSSPRTPSTESTSSHTSLKEGVGMSEVEESRGEGVERRRNKYHEDEDSPSDYFEEEEEEEIVVEEKKEEVEEKCNGDMNGEASKRGENEENTENAAPAENGNDTTEKKKKKKRKEGEKKTKKKKKVAYLNREDILEKHVGPRVRSFDANKMKSKFEKPKVAQVSNDCKKCGKQVFQMEKIVAEKASWHKNCFRCAECNCILTLETYQSHEGVLYCKVHFKALFQPKAVLEDPGEKYLSRRPKMIILESQPEELPADVVRSGNKEDTALEALSTDNLKKKFMMFEAISTLEDDYGDPIAVRRSQSLRNRAQGGEDDYGVENSELGDYDENEEEEEEEEEEQEEEDDENENPDQAKIRKKVKSTSFSGMQDIKAMKAAKKRREMMARNRREEIAKFRQMLCAGKNISTREVFEGANLDDLEYDKPTRKQQIKLDSITAAKELRERFESGEIMHEKKHSEDKKDVDEIFKEAETANRARSLFKQIDSAANQEQEMGPLRRSRSTAEARKEHRLSIDGRQIRNFSMMEEEEDDDAKMHIECSSIKNKFKFFATYEDRVKEAERTKKKVFRITPPRDDEKGIDVEEQELGRDPNYVRCTDNYEDEVDCRKTRSVIAMFRKMEMQNDDDEKGPRPLKQFTPPPEGEEFSDEEEYSDEEYSDEEDEEDEEEDEYERKVPKYKDEILEMLSARKAASLRAKFEKWESDADHNNENNYNDDDEECMPSIDTARNLRAMFENKAQEASRPVERPKIKVNRFV